MAINGNQRQTTAINCNQLRSKATHLVEDRQFRIRVRRTLETDDAQPDDPRRARRSARRPGHARRARARVRRRRSTRLAPRVGGCARAAHRTRTPPGRVHVSQVRQELPKQQQQVPSKIRSERHKWHQCREHATTGLSGQAGQAACPVKQLGPVRVERMQMRGSHRPEQRSVFLIDIESKTSERICGCASGTLPKRTSSNDTPACATLARSPGVPVPRAVLPSLPPSTTSSSSSAAMPFVGNSAPVTAPCSSRSRRHRSRLHRSPFHHGRCRPWAPQPLR